MKQFLKAMLSEASDVSAMRVMAFVALTMACILAFMGRDSYISFLTAAFAGKVAQKITENAK